MLSTYELWIRYHWKSELWSDRKCKDKVLHNNLVSDDPWKKLWCLSFHKTRATKLFIAGFRKFDICTLNFLSFSNDSDILFRPWNEWIQISNETNGFNHNFNDRNLGLIILRQIWVWFIWNWHFDITLQHCLYKRFLVLKILADLVLSETVYHQFHFWLSWHISCIQSTHRLLNENP